MANARPSLSAPVSWTFIEAEMSQRDEIEVTALAAVRMSPRQIAARKTESSNCGGIIM
ncbi:MAG: hypothetical protein ACOY4O_10175 [Pseudomonadota bacterium]